MERELGFTLIELLAALVVGSLLMLALTGVSSNMGRDLRRSEVASQSRKLLETQQLLHRLFDSIQFEKGRSSLAIEERSATALVGSPIALGPIGTVRMNLDAVRRKDGEALELRFEALEGQSLPEPARKPIILIDGQHSIRLEASGSKGAASRELLIMVEDRQRVVRTLAFVSPVNGDGACRFDPISMACRQ